MPHWPLDDPPTDRERRIWHRLWKTPQAIMWERMSWFDVVARYARVSAEAQDVARRVIKAADPDGPDVLVENRAVTSSRVEARQLEDRLGLTPASMLQLRWVITDDVEDASPAEAPIDVRQRLRAL